MADPTSAGFDVMVSGPRSRLEALNLAVVIASRHGDEGAEVTVTRAEAFHAFLASSAGESENQAHLYGG